MPAQLTLALPVRAALGRADFLVSPANRTALDLIDRPDLWPQGKLILAGPEGSGKSHLAEVFAHDRAAMIVEARDLFDIGPAPEALVVEDMEELPADRQEMMFHLHNRIAARGGLLLMTARRPVADWGLTLADLQSRMAAAAAVRLDPPDDALLAALIVKLFADRQLQVPATVVAYLVGRIERSFAAARAVVAAIDARSLALGRPVTRALAAEVLDRTAAP